MVFKELLLLPGAIAGTDKSSTPQTEQIQAIKGERGEGTIDFFTAKNLLNNLQTGEINDSLQYSNFTAKELISVFGEIPTIHNTIDLHNVDMEVFQQKVKQYAVLANYAYNLQEGKGKDSIYNKYIYDLPGYPLEEPDYTLAAEYDKKVVDLYSLLITGVIVEPGENYVNLEPQIVRFINYSLQKFNKYVTDSQKAEIQKILGDLAGGSGTPDIPEDKESPDISQQEWEQYKKIIDKMTTKVRYLSQDYIGNKEFDMYFPVSEKYIIFAHLLALLTNNHDGIARATNIQGGLLAKKTENIVEGQSDNAQRAIELIKKSEEEFAKVGVVQPGKSENNIGEIYFNMKAYPMALMEYQKSLYQKEQGYRNALSKLVQLQVQIDTLADTAIITNNISGKSTDNNDKNIYFCDSTDISYDYKVIATDILKHIVEHKQVKTKEFSELVDSISIVVRKIIHTIDKLEKNKENIDIVNLKRIQEYITKFSNVSGDINMITSIEAPYINIGKVKIVMGIDQKSRDLLDEGKQSLDIAEHLESKKKKNDAELNYYLGEYYKYTRNFRKAQEYFLRVYNNPNADIKYKYQAAEGLEFTSFTYPEKFKRAEEAKRLKEAYNTIAHRIQMSMNRYAELVEERNKAQDERKKLEAENAQKMREKDAAAKLMKQKMWMGGGAGLFMLLGIMGWLISLKKKNRIISGQKSKLEEFKNIIDQSGNAVVIKDPTGEILFKNKVYSEILQQDIVSTSGLSQGMFQTCRDTGEPQEYTEVVIWNRDPETINAEEIEKARQSEVSKYIFVQEGGKEVIREQRHYKITLTPHKNTKGEIVQIDSMSIDVTKDELNKRFQQQQQIEILQKNEAIESKNKQIGDSINYAQKIQEAMLPSKDDMKALGEHFVFYKPKDIVSGDFYWVRTDPNNPERIAVATVDCTGHGVPGAMMSMLGISSLDDIWNKDPHLTPVEILNELDQRVKASLQKVSGDKMQDGMDLSIYILDRATGKLSYAGAQNDLHLIDKQGVMQTLPATRRGINDNDRNNKEFQGYTVRLEPGTMIYSHSDGYHSQIGGPKLKKLMKGKYRELLSEVSSYDISKQREIVESFLEKWKGNESQIDDVLVIGVKYSAIKP